MPRAIALAQGLDVYSPRALDVISIAHVVCPVRDVVLVDDDHFQGLNPRLRAQRHQAAYQFVIQAVIDDKGRDGASREGDRHESVLDPAV